MLTPVAPEVWQLPCPPFRLPAGARMPLSTTVIRLPGHQLLLYSPAAIDDERAAAVEALGEVAHVVAPSLFHHVFAGKAAARWPRAVLHGPAALRRKRPDLAIGRELADPDPSWRDVLEVERIGGAPKIDEHVLFHRPSGTLVCADFVFHITSPANAMTRLVLAITGTGGGRLAQSRVWRFAVRDRAAARVSIERVLRWPIERVSPTHGEAVAIDAAELAPLLARGWGGKVTAAIPAVTTVR